MNNRILLRYMLNSLIYVVAIFTLCSTTVDKDYLAPKGLLKFEVKNESDETIFTDFCIIIGAKTNENGKYIIPYFGEPTRLLPNQQCEFEEEYFEYDVDNALVVVYQYSEETLKKYTKEEIEKYSLYDKVYTKPLEECIDTKQTFILL